MLPVAYARKQFEQVSAPDQLLVHEHEKRMWQSIERAIRDDDTAIFYEVQALDGPWGHASTDAIALLLIKRLRSLGYDTLLVQHAPNILRVSGWVVPLAPPPPVSADKKKEAAAVKQARYGSLSSHLRSVNKKLDRQHRRRH